MTKAKIISFIKRDIRKLEREQQFIKAKMKKRQMAKGSDHHTLLTHVISRKHTLQEILSML